MDLDADLDSERFCYVTTTGRRTGKPHQIEIWFVERDRTIYLLMGGGEGADTVRNLRADPNVSVRIAARTWLATARVVDDPAEATLVRDLLPAKYAHDEDGLVDWAGGALPVRIDLPAD